MKRDEKLSAGMPMRRTIVGMSVLTCLGVGVGSLTLLSICRDASAAERPGGSQDDDDEADAPRFAVDPFWGLLPNNWMLGQVSGIAVDADDHVWVLHRPRTLDARQRGEEGMCCVPAPPVSRVIPRRYGASVVGWTGGGF